jgi:hypothetical protein
MNDLLDKRLAHLYPEYPSIPPRSRRNWFSENAMKVFTEELEMSDKEADEFRGIVFDTLEWSSWKIETIKECVSQGLKKHPAEDFAKGLVPAIVGSVARFEAESRGDIDSDFIYDKTCIKSSDADRLIRDFIKNTNWKLSETPPKEGVTFNLSEEEDIDMYSLEDISRIDHFTNLLVGCRILENDDKFNTLMSQARLNTEKKSILKEFIKRIDADLTGRKKERVPVKIGYTIMTYVVRMLALNYLEDGDVDKNYWRICELLYGKINEEFWKELATTVQHLVYARERMNKHERVRKHISEEKILYASRYIYEAVLWLKSEELR